MSFHLKKIGGGITMDIIIHSKSVDYLKSSINRCVGYNWQRIKELERIATLIDFLRLKIAFLKVRD